MMRPYVFLALGVDKKLTTRAFNKNDMNCSGMSSHYLITILLIHKEKLKLNLLVDVLTFFLMLAISVDIAKARDLS